MEEVPSGKRLKGGARLCWGTGRWSQRITVRFKQLGLFPLVAHFFHFQVSRFESSMEGRKEGREGGREGGRLALRCHPLYFTCMASAGSLWRGDLSAWPNQAVDVYHHCHQNGSITAVAPGLKQRHSEACGVRCPGLCVPWSKAPQCQDPTVL